MATVGEIIDGKLAGKLKEKKGELSGIIVLDISGPEGGKWTVDCDNGTIEKKDAENAAVRVIMADADFKDMIGGGLNPASAMFSGKLKIEGDMSLATKLAMAIR